MHDNDDDITYDDGDLLRGRTLYLVVDLDDEPAGLYEDRDDANEKAAECDGEVYEMKVQ